MNPDHLQSIGRCIGLLGGSFDPVHRAHLALASAFAHALPLDEIRFIPAGQPWQKEGLAATPRQRLAMLELSLNELVRSLPGTCRASIDTRELERAGPSYTVETLIELRKEMDRPFGPAASLVLLLGADQLLRLDTWRRWTELFNLAHLAVATRPGFDLNALPTPVLDQWTMRLADPRDLKSRQHGCTWQLDGFAMDVSATAVRTALKTGDYASPILADFVPGAVLDYIQAHHLYR